jgi:amidase
MIDHCGPMAGSVRDTALLLSVLAGYDGMDPRMTPETPLRQNVPQYHEILDKAIAERTAAGTWTPSESAKGLRIGVLTEGWEVPTISAEVRAATLAACARFAAHGAIVEDVSIPMHKIGPAIWTAATRGEMLETFTNVPPTLLSHPLTDLDPPRPNQAWYDNVHAHNPATVNVFFAGAHLSGLPPAYRNKAVSHVHELRAAYDAALARYDVLVTPAAPTVAMQRDARWHDGGVMGHLELALGNNMNTGMFNVTGHPAMVMPVAWGSPREEGVKGKLPIGLQIVGKRFGESDMFLAAAALEVGGSAYDEW